MSVVSGLLRSAVGSALLLAANPALANDSEAEVGIGGITLLPSSTIQLVSEDLYVSERLVRVEYVFRNPSDQAVETTVAFPMPAQPRGMVDTSFWFYDERQDWSDFGFATYVDDQPVRLQQVDRAMIAERDVTALLESRGLPLFWVERGINNPFVGMGDAELAPYLAEGLAVADPLFDGQVVPAWDVITYFVREQRFPANSELRVRHEYAPYLGGSAGGSLYPAVREYEGVLEDYQDRWCVDDSFLAGVDRRLAEAGGPQGVFMGETWLSYVLSSGANWAGPIENFRLVVDKGSPDNLVSFCMDGVTRISPTQFEVRRTNFEPDGDLDVLLVSFYPIDG